MEEEKQPLKRKRIVVLNYEQQVHRQIGRVTDAFNGIPFENLEGHLVNRTSIFVIGDRLSSLENLISPYIDEQYKQQRTAMAISIKAKEKKADDLWLLRDWFRNLLALLNRKGMLKKVSA